MGPKRKALKMRERDEAAGIDTGIYLVTCTSSKCLQLSVEDVASWEEHCIARTKPWTPPPVLH